MSVKPWNWYVEYSSPYHGYMYAVKSYLYSGETPYQRGMLTWTAAWVK